MKSEKVKILLDADVVIHFIKGGACRCCRIFCRLINLPFWILCWIGSYLSTMDLLYLACHRKVMTEQACDRFIADVLRQGSKLPVSKLSLYMPRAEVFSL